HEGGGEPDPREGAPVDAGFSPTKKPLPVPTSLLPGGPGQREGCGGGPGEVHATELLRARAAGAGSGATQPGLASTLRGGSAAAVAWSVGHQGAVVVGRSKSVPAAAGHTLRGVPQSLDDRELLVVGAF